MEEDIPKGMNELHLGFCHGDLNLFNLMDGKVIDFEDAGTGFVEADMVNFAFHHLMFGDGSYRKIAYAFSVAQGEEMFEQFDRLTDGTFSRNIGKAMMYRIPWWLSGLQEFPEFRASRMRQAIGLIEKFFEGKLDREYILSEYNTNYQEVLKRNALYAKS